jgi:diacylglycerol kinase family enzyme
MEAYDYIIINGGDGTIRRVLKHIHTLDTLPPFILNPTGSFNVVAKLHQVPKLDKVLELLANGKTPVTNTQQIYRLNDEVFLFSAGNMGDLQHIFLSETLRFGLMEQGIGKYILALLFLFPVHLVMTPFMLMSKRRFFIFTPAGFIKKFGSFYGEVKEMHIDLKNGHNLIELDGDIVTINESTLNIKPFGSIQILGKISDTGNT